jgi:gliding motility-associated-like protein
VLAVFVFSVPANSQIVINEYTAANTTGSDVDNFGQFEDWVELYNAGSSTVSLAGYYMSDNGNNPTKWQFPASSGTISPGGFAKVICSGQNTVTAGWYHTDFKLTQCKPEMVVLADPSGTIIDSMTIRRNQADDTWGRFPDGSNNWKIFQGGTMGTSNNSATAYDSYATRPVLSVQAGFYGGTQSVTITSPDPNVTIHYTVNGTDPTTSSATYSSPVSISSTQVLRARAFSSTATILPSFIETNTYFIGITHTVPVLSICGDNVMQLMNGTQSYPGTTLEYFDAGGTFRAEVTGETNKHGNDSWAYNQRGIDFVTRDQFGYDYAVRWKLFHRKQRNKFQRIIIKAAANDNYPFETGGAHIRDAYVHDLSQKGQLHLDERSYEPCILYVNGQYWGVYEIREKVDDADFTSYYYDQDEPNIQMLKTWGGTWSEYGGAQAQTDWNTLESFIVSNNMATAANWNYVDSLYNWKSLADYIILNSVCVTSDWLNWNTMWWRGLDTNGSAKRWRYGLWDNDATFGHYINYTGIPDTSPNADPCNPESLPDPGGQGHVPVLNALMNNPTFYQYYVTRYADLMNTSLSCDTMIDLLDTLILHITPEMPGQVAKWGGSMGGWQGNVTAMRTYIQARCVALQQGMVDCYNLNGPYAITIDVSPAGAGTVDVNSLHLDQFPWNGQYYGGIPTLLSTAPTSSQYVFDHWEILDSPTPSTTDDTISVDLTQPQTIVAVYKTQDNSTPLGDAYIPTAFSPNGDGNNDIYTLHGLEGMKTVNFMVYNRWGQLVFSSQEKNASWDGTTGGKMNPSGVYAYVLSVTKPDGTSETQSGNITLMR